MDDIIDFAVIQLHDPLKKEVCLDLSSWSDTVR